MRMEKCFCSIPKQFARARKIQISQRLLSCSPRGGGGYSLTVFHVKSMQDKFHDSSFLHIRGPQILQINIR